MKPVRIGQMDREIEIEELVEVRNADYGSIQKTFRFLAKVWAYYQPMAATEMAESLAAESMRAIEVATFTIRHYPNLTPTMRIVYDGKIYNIKSISQWGDFRSRFINIVAKAEMGAKVSHSSTLPTLSILTSTNPISAEVSP